MIKASVAVVMGGPSAEYDVSIATGVEMLRHLAGRLPLLRAVIIDRERRFFLRDVSPTSVPTVSQASAPSATNGFEGPFGASDARAVWDGIDVALLGLHGEFGEDGRFQGYLETVGVPYSGSGVFASSVGMDKIATKQILMQLGIPTPAFTVCGSDYPAETTQTIIRKLGLPCFIKCPQSGSSKLMGRAETEQELQSLIEELSPHSPTLLVEPSVQGIEMSCPVLEYPDGTTKPLLPVEIRPVKASFFDYEAKYTDGACEEIVPAPRPPEMLATVQQIALQVHKALKCRGVSRTDVIVSAGTPYVLEINTLPGFTPASLVPKSYAAAGGTYEQLLDILMQGALARARTRVG